MNQNVKRGKEAIPMVPYLRLPDSEEEKAYLAGTRCGHCGETYLGRKAICLRCARSDEMDEVALSREGELFTYTVIHQSAPWVKVPYVAGMVKLPEGPLVRTSLSGVTPDPGLLRVGMPVGLVTEKVREDDEDREIIAYKFKPL